MPRCTAWGSVRSSKEHNRAVWGFTSTCHKHTSMPLENTHHLKTHINVIRQCGGSRSNSPDPRPTPPSPRVLVTPSFPHPPGPQMTLKSGSSSHIIIITQCSRRSNSPAPRPTHFHPWGLGSPPPPPPPPHPETTSDPEFAEIRIIIILRAFWNKLCFQHHDLSLQQTQQQTDSLASNHSKSFVSVIESSVSFITDRISWPRYVISVSVV